MVDTNCSIPSDLPTGFEKAIDVLTSKPYYLDHNTRTASWSHPRHAILREPNSPGLPYPYDLGIDQGERAYYIHRATKTTSWMHPVRFQELKASGILEAEDDTYGGEDGQAWKGWILGTVAGKGEFEGEEYWVNYRDGTVNWQSPEDIRLGAEAVRQKKAALKGAFVWEIMKGRIRGGAIAYDIFQG